MTYEPTHISIHDGSDVMAVPTCETCVGDTQFLAVNENGDELILELNEWAPIGA